MKITWINVGVAVVAVALLAGAYRQSPTMRATVTVLGCQFLGWTAEPHRDDAVSVTEPRERTLDAAAIVELPTTPTTDLTIPKHPSAERLLIQQQSVQQF